MAKGERGLVVLLPFAATVVLLAACGGGGSNSNGEADKSAAAILADAKRAAIDAGSTHVIGAGHESRQKFGLDLRITRHGGGGWMSFQGSKIELIRVGKTAYFRASSSFYEKFGEGTAEARKAEGQLMGGRWMKVPVSNPDFADLASLTQMNTFFTELLKPEGPVSKGVETTINGQKAIEVKSPKDSSLYVAETGKPYPLVVSDGTGDAIKLSEWGTATAPAAPKNAIDYAALLKTP